MRTTCKSLKDPRIIVALFEYPIEQQLTKFFHNIFIVWRDKFTFLRGVKNSAILIFLLSGPHRWDETGILMGIVAYIVCLTAVKIGMLIYQIYLYHKFKLYYAEPSLEKREKMTGNIHHIVYVRTLLKREEDFPYAVGEAGNRKIDLSIFYKREIRSRLLWLAGAVSTLYIFFMLF